MGYAIVLSNEVTNNTSFTVYGNIIYWSSLKCKRITRSVLASKIYAIAYSVNIAIAIRATLNIIINRLSLLLRTNCRVHGFAVPVQVLFEGVTC
jgi:hypothetical protein